MKKEAGLRIDYRQVVILTLADQVEETAQTISDIEKQVWYLDVSHEAHVDTKETRRDKQARHFDDYLSPYYDEVIVSPCDADSMLIFGSGEAESEFQKQLEDFALRERIVVIETTDSIDGWSDCGWDRTTQQRQTDQETRGLDG